MNSQKNVLCIMGNSKQRWPISKTKLETKPYWMCAYMSLTNKRDITSASYYIIPMKASNEKILKAIFSPGSKFFGIDFISIKTSIYYDDPQTVHKIARILAQKKTHFMLEIGRESEGTVTPQVVEAITSDELTNRYFLGLKEPEPPVPSLKHGEERCYWLTNTHYLMANDGIYPTPQKHRTHKLPAKESYFRLKREPLPKPIENPVEFLKYFRESYHRWIDPYLELLSPDQVMSMVMWVGSAYQHFSGYHATKHALGSFPFTRWSIISEVNNIDRPAAYSEARGISRSGGAPWGIMIGGVIFKYWEIYLRHTERATFSRERFRTAGYATSLDCPGWLFFIPSAIAWLGGGRMFMHESTEVQLTRNKSIRAAIGSLHRLLKETCPPWDPEVRTALLKGDAYYAWDTPGYDTGMKEELNPTEKTCLGMRTGSLEYRVPHINSVFYPRINGNREWQELIHSGNPYGEIDILPPYAPQETLKNYDKVIMVEWNCLRDENYKQLLKYVKGGGTLFLCASQLISQEQGMINWRTPAKGEFYNNGDLRELCGIELGGGKDELKGSSVLRIHNDPEGIFAKREHKVENIATYRIRRLAGDAKVIITADKKIPVCVYKPQGKGGVYTVLGPSYYAALKEYMEVFFKQIAEHNLQTLSYTIDRVTDEERKDLVVYRDYERARMALINYWCRYDITPRLSLKDVKAGRYVQRIDVYGCRGKIAGVMMPSRRITEFTTEVTLRIRSAAVVSYEKGDSKDFRFEYQVMEIDKIFAFYELTCQPIERFGNVWVKTIRGEAKDYMYDTWAMLEIEIGGLPRGRWSFEARVFDNKGKLKTRRRFLEASTMRKMLKLDKDLLGKVYTDWRIEIRGGKKL